MKEKGADEEKIKKFQNGAQAYFKDVIGPNFKDYDFYVGESMDTDGMWVIEEMGGCSANTDFCQGRFVELPRGWHHSIHHNLEIWSG